MMSPQPAVHPAPCPAEPAGLYVHIPFCLKKCFYCDFYSVIHVSLHPAFLDALIFEMQLNSSAALTFDTLYLGGGTPSLLNAADIGRIIEAADHWFDLQAGAEITIEINPGTLTPEKLHEYRRVGINRLSIGVQSFKPQNLKFLGRSHTGRDAEQALQWSRAADFTNLGIDLIYGLPGQTEAFWLEDLQRALEFEPEHLACYMLTYECGTLLDEYRKKGRFRPLSDHSSGALFEMTQAYLSSRGYTCYEISNFARNASGGQGMRSFESNRSRHNLKYWSFAPYLGLGPSAHSFREPERRWNHADVNGYIKDLAAGRYPPASKELLNRTQLMIEAIHLGLRQTQGIGVPGFEKKFEVNFWQRFGKTVESLVRKGFISHTQDCCALTPKGMLYLDSITALLVDQI